MNVILPEKYKRLIAKQMADQGPRAVIEAMVKVMVPPEEARANTVGVAIEKMRLTLVEVLKHWPEDYRFPEVALRNLVKSVRQYDCEYASVAGSPEDYEEIYMRVRNAAEAAGVEWPE